MIHEEDNELTIIKKEVKSHEYSVYLSEDISHSVLKYADLIHLLRYEVNADDTVNIFLSNYGGSCDTATAIINAINSCSGTVTAIVSSACYSAATLIALSCDKLVLADHSFLMMHNFSNTYLGKAGEIKAEVANTEKLIHGLMQSIYAPFLTKAEINAILNDKDVYIHWNDGSLDERIERHFGGTSD